MPGKIKRMIDEIIEKKAAGNPVIAKTTATKILLLGVSINKFDASSPDDPAVMEKLSKFAKDSGLSLSVK